MKRLKIILRHARMILLRIILATVFMMIGEWAVGHFGFGENRALGLFFLIGCFYGCLFVAIDWLKKTKDKTTFQTKVEDSIACLVQAHENFSAPYEELTAVLEKNGKLYRVIVEEVVKDEVKK